MVDLSTYVSLAFSDNAYTPDIPYLTRRYEEVPLFVYNQYRIGMCEHSRLNGSRFLGRGYAVPLYRVLMFDSGEPLAFQSGKPEELSTVSGEVFSVPISVLVSIDREMCNTVHCRRRLVPIRVSTSRDNTSEFIAECWMYEAEETNLQPYLHRFRVAPLISGNNGKTFLYTCLMDLKTTRRRDGVNS